MYLHDVGTSIRPSWKTLWIAANWTPNFGRFYSIWQRPSWRRYRWYKAHCFFEPIVWGHFVETCSVSPNRTCTLDVLMHLRHDRRSQVLQTWAPVELVFTALYCGFHDAGTSSSGTNGTREELVEVETADCTWKCTLHLHENAHMLYMTMLCHELPWPGVLLIARKKYPSSCLRSKNQRYKRTINKGKITCLLLYVA